MSGPVWSGEGRAVEVYIYWTGLERVKVANNTLPALFTPHVRNLFKPVFFIPLSRSHDCHETPPHPLQRPAKPPHTINVPTTVADIVTAPAYAATSHAISRHTNNSIYALAQ